LLAISNRHSEGVARVIQRTMDFITKNPRASFAEVREIAQTEGLRQASALNQCGQLSNPEDDAPASAI
jgi:hypothetical protein